MADTFDEIMDEIFLQLNGDAKHDIESLMSAAEKYKDHEYGKEITRAIGRKIYDVLPAERREELDVIMQSHGDASENVLNETMLAIQKGDMSKALSIIEPYALKLKECHQKGICTEDAESVYYDFDSIVQYIFAAETIDTDKEIRPAIEPFAQTFGLYAAILYEVGRHEDAIEWLKRAIRWNPMAPQYYFELADNYKVLGDMQAARKVCDEVFDCITNAGELARWYRDRGFISIETGNYELAAAEFRYSTLFEPSANAMAELLYIKQGYGEDYTDMDIEKAAEILAANEIPLNVPERTFGLLIAIYDLLMEQGEQEIASQVAASIYSLTDEDAWRDRI